MENGFCTRLGIGNGHVTKNHAWEMRCQTWDLANAHPELTIKHADIDQQTLAVSQ